jgi:hypothetical protein
MAGITYIKRDYGDVVTIVRLVTTDSLSTAGSSNYILNQATNISNANNGPFEWLPNDVVLVSASDGFEFFSIASNYNSLNQSGAGYQQVNVALTAAQIDGMYAAPVLIVPAPAAGTINYVQSAILNEVYGGTVFANGGAIALQYKNTVNGGGVLASSTISAADLIAETANNSFVMTGASGVLSANTIGQGIYLSNVTGAFTGGTGSTFNLNVLYRNLAAS